MSAKDDAIQIVLAVYDPKGTYSRHAGVVMTSLFSRTKSPVCVTVLHDDSLNVDNRRRMLETAETSGQAVRFVDVSASIATLGDDLDDLTRQFSRGALFRLLLPELLDVPKAIYLDCDIAVNMDITELWAVDVSGASLAATRDVGVIGQAKSLYGRIRSWAMGYDAENYFNSGVLLMNLERIRLKCDLMEEGARFFKRHRLCLDYPDQDLFNALFRGDTVFIDERFDRIRDRQNIDDAILHLTGTYKPWTVHECAPRDYFYWETFARSEWRDQLIDAMLEMYKNNPTAHLHTSACFKRILFRLKQDVFVRNPLFLLFRDARIVWDELRARSIDRKRMPR